MDKQIISKKKWFKNSKMQNLSRRFMT